MIMRSDIVMLDITIDDILKAITTAQKYYFIDNLRDRCPAVSFDSKVRGLIGEIGIVKWFTKNRVRCVNAQNYEHMDTYANIDLTVRGMAQDYSCEIKTSDMPMSSGNLIQGCIDRCNIMLFKRSDNPALDLDRDIYVQIFYYVNTEERDLFLKGLNVSDDDIYRMTAEAIYDKFRCGIYLESCFFVCWIDKNNAILLINSMDVKSYAFGKREFWKCPVKNAMKPAILSTYLRV